MELSEGMEKIRNKEITVSVVAKKLNVCRRTLYNKLNDKEGIGAPRIFWKALKNMCCS